MMEEIEAIHSSIGACGSCEPRRGCQDTRHNYIGKRVYTEPEDSTDEHDLLRNNYDNRNTRMMMTLKNLGFGIADIGSAYHYMKYHYFSFREQYRFRPYMNAICNIVENARFYAVHNMAHSESLRLHKCDFNTLVYSSTWKLSAHSLDLCTKWKKMSSRTQWGRKEPESEDLNRFAKTFFKNIVGTHEVFKEPIESWKKHEQTLLQAERRDFNLLLGNKKKSWRLLTCTLPAFILTNTRRIIAEQREDGCLHYIEREGGQSDPTYDDYRYANECIHKTHLANVTHNRGC